MAKYVCRYLTENNKIVEEIIEASEKNELISTLRNRGYNIISVKESFGKGGKLSIGSSHLKKKDLSLFCRQLSSMLTSGIPMVKCFEVIGSQSDKKNYKILMSELSGDVLAGLALSVAMERHPDDFPVMLCEMVRVGEVTGDLNAVLLRMAEQYEKECKINQKIKSALAYPIVVLFVAIAACVFMLIKVVPSFVDVFDSLGADLPVLTKVLLSLSTFITTKWYILLVALPVAVILIIRAFKLKSVKKVVDKLKVSLPGIKGPMRKIMAARFARTLHTLVSSGVPIVQALENTKRSVMNLYVGEFIDRIIVGVQQGKDISSQMAEMPIFPKILTSMLSVGENSGDLEGMLSKCADYFDDETAASIEQLMTIIEPLMIVVVGLLIGVIVLALYAPMFGAITAMQEAV